MENKTRGGPSKLKKPPAPPPKPPARSGPVIAFEPDTVYHVESPEDDGAMLALDPKLSKRLVEWFDTSHDRALEVKSAARDGKAIVVKTAAGQYRFEPLTLEVYNARVIGRVTGHRPFASTEEVQTFYRAFPR